MPDRRHFVAGAVATLATAPLAGQIPRDPLAAIRAGTGGRLGVAAYDTGTGRRLSSDATSRYAMCSTFKAPLAAAVLARADAGRLDLATPIAFGADALLEYAPTVRANLDAGRLTIEQLCEAAVKLSDNSAANLLLAQVGGPAGLTRFFRAQRDRVTRLDRTEPTLNVVRGGDIRDTTTPLAMAALLERLCTTDALSAASRKKLIGWMVASPTGRERLRAGLPGDWVVGDKTGTSGEGYVGDIAVAWPPGRKPIVIACYLDAPGLSLDRANAAHAQVGALVGRLFG